MLNKANSIRDQIVAYRRDFHQFPEIGYKETRTAGVIADRLRELGLNPKTKIARTGVVADIGSNNGKTVLIRADMDALPIQEATGLAFASKSPGIMHACGHDAHSAILLGAADILCQSEIQGRIRLVFQPSEEDSNGDPEGLSGASRMIKEGLLDGVDAAVALHIMPEMPVGQIDIKAGAVLAAASVFEIIVQGQASHAGAYPHKGVDAVLIASQIVQALNTVISRNIAPDKSAVLSVCTINGGCASNVIADKVKITGTLRALEDETHSTILSRSENLVLGIASSFGASATFSLTHGVPVTVNSPDLALLARKSAAKLVPPDGILAIPPVMAGEDFGFIANEVPSVFMLLGAKPDGRDAFPLHDPRFDLNEDALPIGAALLSQTAIDLLEALNL